MLVIGGLALVAGAFIFKDQICPIIPIPFICDSAAGGGPGSFAEDVVANCAKQCPGGAKNGACLDACARRAAEGTVPAKSSVQLPNGMTRYLACDIETDPDCYQSRYASPAAPPQVLPSFYELTGDEILNRL